MTKYSSLFIIIVGIIILFIIFGGDLESNDDKHKKLVSSEDNIVGIWTTDKCVDTDESDNSKIEAAAIQFNEDGSCAYAVIYSTDISSSSAKIEQRNEGLCYLNNSKTKLKMEKEDNPIIDWEKYSNDGNILIIGNCEYKKVS